MKKMPPKKKTKTGDSQEKSASFTWSDEELELLLNVILHYKADKEGRGFDWQSVKTKYDDLRNLFLERYPREGASTDFPHDAERDFTKERMNLKIKVLRQKYRGALDSGKRSGGGKIVAQFYDKCSEIWGGSPATHAFTHGIETSDQTILLADSPKSITGTSEIAAGDDEVLDEMAQPNAVGPDTPGRHLISHMKERRNAKLLKTIPSDKQCLEIAKADLEIKKDIMAELKKSNQEHAEHMKVLTGTLVNLSNALTAALNPYQYSGHHNKQYHPGQGYNDYSFMQQQIPVNANRPNTFQGTMEEADEEHVFTNLS